MSNHLARPSQRPAQRRLHRLSFRPISDVSEEQDQATLKAPVFRPIPVKPPREFLPIAETPVQPRIQQQQTQFKQEPQKKEGALLKVKPQQIEREQTVPLADKESRDLALLETRKTSKPVTFAFDINHPTSQPNSNTHAFDDDPEFEKRSTIPMIVLKGISAQQGKQQSVMKSEVTGAAGAAGLVGFGNILGSILKYGSTFLIQYSLGPGLYGLYTLSLSLINLVSAIFSLGLDSAMTRYIAIYRGKKQVSSLRGLMVFCTTVVGIAGIAGALLLLFFTPSLVAFWTSIRPTQAINNRETLKQMTPLLQLMAPMIPLMAMQVIWFGGLRGFKAFKWRVLATSILQPIVLILLLLLMIRFFRGVTGVALVMVISTAFTAVLYLFFLFHEYSRVATEEPEQYELREWIVYSTLNFLTTIISTILDSVDTILLASFGISKVAIGQYGAAIKLGPIIGMPLLSLNIIFGPTIAELHSKGEKRKLEELFKIVTKWTIVFSFPIFLIACLFSPYLLGLSGAGYISAWPLVIAFSIGNMFGAATGSVGSMLLMTGYNKLSFVSSLVAVAVNIVLGVILTPLYGAMGTAISTGIAICVLNVVRLILVRIMLKMQPYRWDSLKPLAAGLISSAVTGGLIYMLSRAITHDYFLVGHAVISLELGLIPVFLASYIGVLILLKGSPEDEIVLSALRKKFSRGKKQKKKQEV